MKATGKATKDADLEAIRLEDAGLREDGEVVGVGVGGDVIQYGTDCGFYNCGETLEEFGFHNLRDYEVARLKQQGVLA